MSYLEQVKKILKENNQIKVLKILENAGDKQENLAKQLLQVDFEQINKLYSRRNIKDDTVAEIEPITCVNKNKLTNNEIIELQRMGEEVIKNNQYAIVTMAGGQGTRLGWKGPKGTYKLDVDKNGKYIFEILIEKLKEAKEKYGVELYWYIMTSIDNNTDTINFFEEHNYFGYNKEKVKFFKQGILPLMDFDGNLLVDKNLNLKEASDGNGGVYKALVKSKIIDHMKENNIKWVYVCGVDNIMANMVDDVLLGLAIKNNVSSVSKSIKKAYPEEKVGCFCKKNGNPAIIEYIDMNEDMIKAKDENGNLIYGESNIVAHLFKIELLEEIAKHDLKYHCASKKNSYIDESLKEIIPDEPNTYKFEAFIFDGFKYLNDMIILSVNRDEEFAPIKNAMGVDSPETAKKIYEKNYN